MADRGEDLFGNVQITVPHLKFVALVGIEFLEDIMAQKAINPYANLKLRKQLYMECRAMAEFCLANGKPISPESVKIIESFESEFQSSDSESGSKSGHCENGRNKSMVSALVQTHQELAQTIAPAVPKTVLLLDIEQESSSLFKFLGPVALVRQMMLAAILSILLFLGTVISQYVNTEGGNIFNSDGVPLFVNLVFFLSAAGLGGAFSALYKANRYITDGTFDPNYHASYWIRFFLGLIAGLILAVVISDHAIQSDFLETGVIRPLLAVLGGFSADLVYTFLYRMVESVKALFQGSAETIVRVNKEAMKAQLDNAKTLNQLKLAGNLVKIQQEIGLDSNPGEIKQKIENLLAGLVPEMK